MYTFMAEPLLNILCLLQIIPRKVTFQDFLNAVETHRHTVTETELMKFDAFTKKFGETG